MVLFGMLLSLSLYFFPLRGGGGGTNGWGVVLSPILLFRGIICVFSSNLMMTCLISDSPYVLL